MAGADVAIAGRREDLGQEVAATLMARGRNAIFVQCDVTKAEQVRAMVATVAQHFSRLDIAFNSAGAWRSVLGEEQSEHDRNHVVGVNLTGA